MYYKDDADAVALLGKAIDSLSAFYKRNKADHGCHILPFRIFCPFGLFCEIVSSLLSLQNHQEQPSIYFKRR